MNVQERFLRYVAFPTASDENAPENLCPSTPRQKELGAALMEEMRALGMENARMDEFGYVYGTLPATDKSLPALGLIAHMDVSSASPAEQICARTVRYEGGDVVLNAGKNIVLRAAENDALASHVGEDLIVTDGTTLLGADDKAGIAEILTAAQELTARGLPHGDLAVAFTPDEEIGRGADRFDVPGFGAPYAYTVDGGALGELEYENFNAASAAVAIRGRNIHPGDAKDRMKNAALIAMEYNALLPAFEIPFCTEKYEGFHHLTHMEGAEERAALSYIIRDHNRAKFEAKKQEFLRAAEFINARYGEGTAEVTLRDSYFNMKEKIEPCLFLVENAKRAMERAGVKPLVVPIRGGTDGARLSYMGLPCPNLCTGGHNFHGRFEYISVQAMEKVVEILVHLVSGR